MASRAMHSGRNFVSYRLMSTHIVAQGLNAIVRKVELWQNNNTGDVHVVATNYVTPAECTREDFPFGQHDTGKRYSSTEDALKDMPFNYTPEGEAQ